MVIYVQNKKFLKFYLIYMALILSSDQMLTFNYLHDYMIFKTHAFVCMYICICILCIRICGICYMSYSVDGHGTLSLYHKHIHFL